LSGTSGGSIIAAMAACKTDEELKAEVGLDCLYAKQTNTYDV